MKNFKWGRGRGVEPALDLPLGRDFILDEVKIQLDRYLRSINVIHKGQSEIAIKHCISILRVF